MLKFFILDETTKVPFLVHALVRTEPDGQRFGLCRNSAQFTGGQNVCAEITVRPPVPVHSILVHMWMPRPAARRLKSANDSGSFGIDALLDGLGSVPRSMLGTGL